MYEERKETFTLKDLIIQVLFVGVFIFLLVWLFPLKSDVKKKFDNLNNSLTPLYDQVFNQNVNSMKDAAITYYTTPRLPQKVGQEVKMTLSKMLEENIILPFLDKDGKQCDLIDSYVSVTKMDDEYILKVNLKCDGKEDYLLVHLGCYNYCDGDVCEKKEEEKPQQPVNPSKPVVNDTYLYEYVKVTNGKWGEYGEWSDWNKNVITATDYRQVETKQEKVVTYVEKTVTKEVPNYVTKRVQTGTKQVEYEDTENSCTYDEVIVGYEPIYEVVDVPYLDYEDKTDCKDVQQYKEITTDGDKCLQYGQKIVGTKYVQELDCNDGCKVVTKSIDTYGTDYSNCIKYEQVTEKVPDGTKHECTTTKEPVVKYRPEKQKVGEEPIYDTEENCSEETVTKYRTEPVYENVTVQEGTKKVTETVKEPVETIVTYYRSRTREYISGNVDTKWSKSQNDKSLLNAGYTLTGNSKKQ